MSAAEAAIESLYNFFTTKNRFFLLFSFSYEKPSAWVYRFASICGARGTHVWDEVSESELEERH